MRRRRLLSLFLVFVMLFGLLPTGALASSGGDSSTQDWSLTKDGDVWYLDILNGQITEDELYTALASQSDVFGTPNPAVATTKQNQISYTYQIKKYVVYGDLVTRSGTEEVKTNTEGGYEITGTSVVYARSDSNSSVSLDHENTYSVKYAITTSVPAKDDTSTVSTILKIVENIGGQNMTVTGTVDRYSYSGNAGASFTVRHYYEPTVSISGVENQTGSVTAASGSGKIYDGNNNAVVTVPVVEGYTATATYNSSPVELTANGGSYTGTFTATDSGAVSVVYSQDVGTITVNDFSNGTLDNDIAGTYPAGTVVSFTVTPASASGGEGYYVSSVKVDNDEQLVGQKENNTQDSNSRTVSITVEKDKTHNVNVTIGTKTLTGNKTAEVKFDPSKSAADQLNALKQEIFNKLAVNYVPNGVTYNQLTYQFYQYHDTNNPLGEDGFNAGLITLGNAPTTDDPGGSIDNPFYHTYYDFGERFSKGGDASEKIRISYNGLYIEADVTLVEGRYYTVTWKDYDGSVLESDTGDTAVKYGDTASYGGTTPTRTGVENQYTYSFAGWDTDGDGVVNYTTENLPAVTSNMTFTAVYSPTARTYTVTWKPAGGNWNGSTADKVYSVAYGNTVTQPADPTRTGHTFAGWTPAVSSIMGTANAEYTAQWTVNQYTISFNSNGGSEVTAITQDYGTSVSEPTAPTKEGYTFGDWYTDSSLTTAYDFGTMPAENITVYAKWNPATETKYTVEHHYETLTDDIFAEVDIEEMSGATGAETAAVAKNKTGFTVRAITQGTIAADGSTVVKIYYDRNSYTITWVDGDENTLKTENVKYGATPSYTGDTPTKTATAQYTYTFNNNWSPTVESVTGDKTYTAQFDSAVNSYTITWVDGDGNTLKTETLDYGATPSYSGTTPTKTADDYVYEWKGWNETIVAVSGAATYTAKFDKEALNANNGKIYVNQYYAALSNAAAIETLRTDILAEAGISGDNFVITTTVGIDSLNITATVVIKDGSVDIIEPSWAASENSGLAAGLLARELYGSSRSFVITDNTTGLSKTVTMSIEDTRNAAVIGDLNVSDFGTFDTVAQFEAAVKDAVKATYKDKKDNSGTVSAGYITVKASENPVVAVVDGKTVKTYSVTVSVRSGSNWLETERTFTGITWTVKQYTVTWVDGNGTTLKTDTLEYGSTPTYTGQTPTKTATAQYTYTFNNTWYPTVESVTGDETYTAQFDSTINKYTVIWTWVDAEGKTVTVTEENVEYGTEPVFDEANNEKPTKATTTENGVTTEWSWDGTWTANSNVDTDGKITGNVEYTPNFVGVNGYKVTFMNGTSTVAVKFVSIDANNATIDELVTLTDGTKDNTTFVGWVDKDGNAFTTETIVTSDIIVYANWKTDVNNNNVDDDNETGYVQVSVNDNGLGTVLLSNNDNNMIFINGPDTDGKYTVVYDSTDTANGDKVYVIETPTDTVSTDGDVGYVVKAVEYVSVSDGNTTNVYVEFGVHTLNASNGNIDKLEYNTTNLKNKVLTAANLATTGNYTVTTNVVSSSLTIQVGNNDSEYFIVSDYGNVSYGAATALSAAMGDDTSRSFTITDIDTGVSKTVTITIAESRLTPGYTVGKDSFTVNADTVINEEWLKAHLDITLVDSNNVAITENTPSYSLMLVDAAPTLEVNKTYTVGVKIVILENDCYTGLTDEFPITITVNEAFVKITGIKDSGTITYNPEMSEEEMGNKTVTAYIHDNLTVEYNPDALKNSSYTIKYLANEDTTAPVTVNLNNLDLGIYGSLIPSEYRVFTVEVPVEALWLDIGADYPETTPPSNEKYEAIFDKLIKKYGTDLLLGRTDIDTLKAEFNAILDADEELKLYYQYLAAHKFGEQAQETIQIIVDDTTYGYVPSNVYTITLVDERYETEIRLNSDVAVTYGQYTEDELMALILDGVYAGDEKVSGLDVDFVTDVSNLPASEGTELTVRFKGNANYKPSTATTTIVINRAPVEVTVDNQMVKWGTEYNKLPVTTNPDGVENIQFIVGLDISDVNIDASEGASLGAVKGILGSVQLLLPAELQDLMVIADDALAAAGLNVSFADGASMKLSELQQSVSVLADVLKDSDYSEYFNVLLNMIGSLPTDTADIEIIIGGTLPTNVGAYLIGAVTADANYETAFGVGILVIYPDGIKAELDWKMDDENYIITRSLLTSGVFDADAEAVSVGEGGTLEAATEQAFEVFIGVDIDGNITLESDQTMLNVGAYVEVAMIVNWGNQMYYSAPIARPFVVVAESLDVDFVDASGTVNNERKFVFDNTAKDGMEGNLLVSYKQDGAGYSAGDKVTDYTVKYYYVGVQTNATPYASTTAPVHAGAYTITAIVTVRNDSGDITHAGQGIGALVIEPAESDVTVDNVAVEFDDQEHAVNDLVTATSAVPNLTPDTTVISAGVAIDRLSSNSGLGAVVGVVNVDLPSWLDELMHKLDVLESAYADGIPVSEFLEYVEDIQSALAELGVDTAAFDDAVEVIKQLSENVTLTFHDNKTYSNVGAYLVIAVVTDSDHYPSADVGLMLIYPKATEVELKFEEDWNDNNIFTWAALQTLNLDAQAYDMGTDSVNAAATEMVTNIYLGIIDDGEIVLTNDKSTLDNGVFTQVAFLLDLGTTMYYAEPVSRVFMIVPNPYTIEFVDETGVENDDRVFTFDNTSHAMNAIVKDTDGNVVNDPSGLTITYTGVQTNLKTYKSTEAPVHAGTYVATATYTARDEQGRLVTLAVEVGAMVIMPAEADITVTSAAIPYDEKDHSINSMVTATSVVNGVTPDKTVITASINTDGSFSENLLNAIEGSVNVDLPNWVDNILANYENAADGVSITGFLSAIEDVKAELAENDIETSVFDDLISVLKQLPGDLTLTFEDDYQRKAVGIYLVIGAVTDSDHMPAVDVGYLVIYPQVVDTELKFNNLDANGIFTNELMDGFDFAATAYGENGNVIDAATEQIQYIYFGMDSDGKLVVTGGLDAVQDLAYGVYTQVAFIAEIDSVIYLAEPIARPIIRVPNTVNVDFEDVVASYNGSGIGIGTVTITKLNGDAFDRNDDALTVYYAGISTSGQPYWSETAPVHAGVYSVIALYVDGENIGAHVGSVTIKPAEASIEVSSQAVQYGAEYDITVTVNPADTSIDPSDAKYLLITAGTDLSVSGGALGISSINTINLDFPAAVDSVLEKLNITDSVVTVGDFVAAAELIQSALDKVGYEDEYLTQAVNLLKQMGSGVTVSFKDNYEPENVGVYFLIATVFDPDYISAVDTGVLVIYPNGELVDIEFTTPIPGALNIMPYNTVVDFDFSAYTDKGEDFDSLINNVIFGLTTDGELFVGDGNAANYAGNPNELGAYTQVAYINADLNGLDGEMYVAIPEFRLFSVVKCNYDVIFVDETGAENNDRIFTYDGTAKSMPAIIVDANGNKLDLVPTVYYMGIDTTLDTTWSTTAPTEAGIYSTVAYYFDEAANIYVMTTGLMAIQKAEMVLDLLDTTVIYDGTPKFVDVNNEENTDFVYATIDRTRNVMNIVLDDDLNGALDLLKKYGVEPKTSYDADKVLGAIDDAMVELAATTEYGAVRSVLNKLQSIIPNDGTVTINDSNPVDAGVYEVYAFAYAANYTSQVSEGTLTIEPVELVITAEDKAKVEGEDDPELTYKVTANGEEIPADEVDGLTVTISRKDGEEVGAYAITVTAECDNVNYKVIKTEGATFTITEAEESGVSVSGTAISWNALDNAIYLLYSSEVIDEDIKVDMRLETPKLAHIYTVTKGEIIINDDGKRYDQMFRFDNVKSGTYKLVIYKPGKYIPKIVTITVDGDTVILDEVRLWLKGDVNYSGTVNYTDLQRLYAHLNGANVIIDAEALEVANTNEAGGVNYTDLQRLYAHLNGANEFTD